MRYPQGTPNDGDVTVFRSSDDLVHWEAPAGGGGISADIQNQLNALALGQGVELALMPSYDNVGGQGDRHTIITATSSGLDGTAANLVSGGYFHPTNGTGTGSVAGKYLRLEFAVPVIITEISLDIGPTVSEGTWKYQASQDGTTWVDIVPNFTLTTSGGTGSSGGSDHASRINQLVKAVAAPYAWKHYQLVGVSGTSNQSYLNQIELKILGAE